ncbi:efflux RND transporter periplasmic adaptor subunit [Desulfosporosinus fructosivorans]
MKKKWLTVGVLGLLVLGGVFWASRQINAKSSTPELLTAQVQKGDVRKVITGTGTVNFPHTIPLAFQQAGKLVELNVKAGDEVKKGDVLAQLDPTSLQHTLAQSQANYLSAQAKLQQLEEGFPQSQAQAKSALARAQTALTTAEGNADPDYFANQVWLAEQNVLLASNALALTQAGGNPAAIQQAQTTLNQTLAALTSAHNSQNGGAAQALAAAQADYASAQNQMDQLKNGPKAGELLAAQAAVEQAKATLDIAQTNLANATLMAPSDGVIVTVSVENYQTVTTASIMTLAVGGTQIQADAAIDQADIAQVKVGQTAEVSLDSAPDQPIKARVVLMSLKGTTVQNVTTFNVTLLPDEPNPILYPGMNANVSITVGEAKNVLIIPIVALQSRGKQNGVFVPSVSAAERPNSDSKVSENVDFTPVETGLDDGTSVEIKSGLSEGQEIVIGTLSPAEPAEQTTGFPTPGSGQNPGQALGQFNDVVGGK